MLRKTVASYALLGTAWILFSDKIFNILLKHYDCPRTDQHILQGLTLIATTSIVLHFILKNIINKYKTQAHILENSEKKFRFLVENSPDAFYLHDMNGNILDVNNQACKILGYSTQELKKMNICQIEVICPPEALHDIWKDLKPGPFNFDGIGRRKDGTTFPTEVQGIVFERDEEILGLVATRDVSQRKRLEKELETARDNAIAANQVKNEFIARMSHEIRSPLHIILGMIDVLRETSLNNTQLEHLNSIEGSGELLLRLLEDILDFSKIEANKSSITPEYFSILDIFQEISRESH